MARARTKTFRFDLRVKRRIPPELKCHRFKRQNRFTDTVHRFAARTEIDASLVPTRQNDILQD